MVWGRDYKKMDLYKQHMKKIGFEVTICKSPNEVASKCNLIITSTASEDYILSKDDTLEGTHINAIESDTYSKRELGPGIIEKANMALEHLKLSIKWKGEKLGVLEMRRHYSNYFRGIPKIKNYRSQLVETNEYSEIEKIINAIKLNYPKC